MLPHSHRYSCQCMENQLPHTGILTTHWKMGCPIVSNFQVHNFVSLVGRYLIMKITLQKIMTLYGLSTCAYQPCCFLTWMLSYSVVCIDGECLREHCQMQSASSTVKDILSVSCNYRHKCTEMHTKMMNRSLLFQKFKEVPGQSNRAEQKWDNFDMPHYLLVGALTC